MGRTPRGRIYRKPPTGEYWLVHYVNGKRIRRNLETTDKRVALRRQADIIKPLQVTALASKLKVVVSEINQVKADGAAADAKSRKRLGYGEAWQAYLDARHRPDSGRHTLADYERQWKHFSSWVSAHGRKLAEDTTEGDANAYLAHCETDLKLGPNRYNKVIQSLRLIFRVLAPVCHGMANPFQNATPKRLNPRGHRALTQDEVKTIMSAATGELQVLLALGVFCGFRIGDACLLRWSEVDSERDLISHVPSKTRSRKNKPVHIPIHADLKELLEKTPRQADSEYVLPTAANSYIKDGGCSVSAQVRRLFQDCGLIPKPERKGKASKAPGQQGARPRRSPEVSFHSLRHTFVSQCARAGVSLPVVRELAGHHSEAVQRVYLHVSEAETRNAVASLPSVLSPVAPPPVEAARKRAAEYLASASEESVWFVLKYLEDRRAAPLPESAGKDKVPSASPAAVTETPEAGE